MQIKAFLGSRQDVEEAVRDFLAENPGWWVADTRDWQRPRQLIAPPENLLLRLGSRAQIEREVGLAPGLVIVAVPRGPIDQAVWQAHLQILQADITELNWI